MRNVLIILSFICFQACNQDGIGCFTPAGETVNEDFSIGAFKELDISGNLNIDLHSGDADIISIEAGSNEMLGISYVIKDSILYLSNQNTCNWSRRYKNPKVSMNYRSLEKIVLRGYGTVGSDEVITLRKLRLASIQGSGDFDLNLDVEQLSISSNDVANFYLEGDVQNLGVGHYFNEGIFYGQELRAVNCWVTHRGTNTMHLNVSGTLSGTIESFGNVTLHGQAPQAIDVQESNTGTINQTY